jgi:ABC-type lipoprotein export system ATPase subunit
VAIARAIVHRPKVVLADEPTGNLDSQHADQILKLFQDIHKRFGITIVMITHSQAAAAWASRTIHLADGRIANAG